MNTNTAIRTSMFAPVFRFYKLLINSRKHVPIGKEPKLLTLITSSLKLVADENKNKDILPLQKQVLYNIIKERYNKTESRNIRVHSLLSDLDKEISAQELMNVFILKNGV